MARVAGEPVVVRRWPLWWYRGASTLLAVLVLAQPVLAGQFLSGVYRALGMHSTNANVVAGAAVLMCGAAVLWRAAGGGPGWPIAAGAAEFALITVQVTAGYQRWMTVHIPLGVAVVAVGVVLAVASWRQR